MRSQISLKAELFARALRMGILGVFALFVAVSLFSLLTPAKTSAAVSSTLNFQARLETAGGSIVPDGNYNVEFKLYDLSTSSGSSQGSCTGDADCLWYETRTAANQVRVVNGYLSVNLGSVNALPSTVNWNQQLWLTMRIGGTGTPSWDAEMSPRIQLTAVPYAFQAGALGNGTNQATLDASGNLVFQQVSTVKELSAGTGTQLTIQGGAATTGTNAGGNLLLQGGAGASTGASGSVIVKSNTNNSTTAFQVQNAAGLVAVLNVDTANQAVTVHASNSSTPVLVVQNASGVANIEVRASGDTSNIFIGLGSGSLSTTGSGDTGLGTYALQSNTTGYNNSAFGTNALQLTTTGFKNSAFGYDALQSNTTGSWNSAFGHYSLQANTTGNANAAFGHYTLIANQTGNYNAVFGVGSLQSSIDGNYNSALGADSLQQNVHGIENTAVGRYSMLSINGSQNTAVGAYSLQNATSGTAYSVFGYNAGYQDANGTFTTLSALQNAAAIGAYAQVQANNSIILGSVDNPTKVGIGITIPSNTFSVSPLDYQTGAACSVASSGSNTCSNTSTTFLFGTGTTWTSSMVGDVVIFADGSTSTVSVFTDSTHLTLGSSVSEASGSHYRFHKPGFQVTSSGNTYVQGNSTTQFQIQNAAGTTTLFNADTANLKITVNGDIVNTFNATPGMVQMSLTSTTATHPTNVAVQGKYAYVIENGATSTLEIFDVTNPSSPASVSTFTLNQTNPVQIQVVGKYAYIAEQGASNGKLEIIDVSNPKSPISVAAVAPSGSGSQPQGVYLSGRYAYLTDSGNNNLVIYDISSPSNLSVVSTTATNAGGPAACTANNANGNSPRKVYVQGRYAYVASAGSSTGRLGIFDISNPASPILVGCKDANAGINDIAVWVQGKYAYETEFNSLLRVVNVSDPTNPVTVTTIAGNGYSYQIAGAGRYVFTTAATAANKLTVTDIADPTSPFLAQVFTTNLNDPRGIFWDGRYIYVANNGGNTLQILDVSGLETTAATVHSLEAGNLFVDTNASFGGDISLQGGLTVGATAQVGNGLGVSGTVKFTSNTNSTTAFVVQDTSSNQIFGVDTSGQQVLFGKPGTYDGKLVLYSGTAGNTNTITIKSGNTSGSYTITLPTAVGSSGQCLKANDNSGTLIFGSCGSGTTNTVTFVPEYAGATFSQYGGDGTTSGTNTGFMQSDHYVSGTAKHNYYQWSTDQASAQDYHIITEYQLPSTFGSFASGGWKIWTYVDSLTSTNLQFTIYSNNNTACYSSLQSIKPSSATAWQQISIADPGNGCTFAANDVITIDIKMTAIQPQTQYVKVGELQFGYN